MKDAPLHRSRPWVVLVFLSIALSAIGSPAQDSPETSELAPVPDHSLEARSDLDREFAFVGETFHYSLTITWEGSQPWVNLDPPEVDWTEEIEQVEVRTRSGSKTGPEGPVGEKTFIYDLASSKAGRIRLPDFELEILFREGGRRTVSAPGKEIEIRERPTPASEKVMGALAENRWLILGVSAVAMGGVFFSFVGRRRKGGEETRPEDPWEPLHEGLKRCEALHKTGQTREFYTEIEGILTSACGIWSGRSETKLDRYLEAERLPDSVGAVLAPLVGEIQERKFRPDQPRPEEMQRTYKQARTVLTMLQELHKGKVS